MRIYISGPITGKSREEVEAAFFGAEMKLRGKGHEVINPAKIDHWELPWEDYMLIAEIILRRGNVDQLYALRGYEKSKGSLIEIGWAKLLGIPVVYQETGGRDNPIKSTAIEIIAVNMAIAKTAPYTQIRMVQ